MTELAPTNGSDASVTTRGRLPTVLEALEEDGPLTFAVASDLRDRKVADAAEPLARAEATLDRPAFRRVLRGQLAEVLSPMLDVPYVQPLVDTWCGWSSLREAGAATRGTDTPQTVDLSHRSVSLVKHPQVQVLVDDHEVAHIRFEVTVEITAGLLVAVVRRGRLVAVEGGTCDVEARLSTGDETLVTGHARLEPALHLSLGEGIDLVGVPLQRPG